MGLEGSEICGCHDKCLLVLPSPLKTISKEAYLRYHLFTAVILIYLYALDNDSDLLCL